MKNKIKYFVLYPLILLMVILIFTFNVNELISLGQRIPFGSSYWKDSLSDAISTNKSIKLGTGDSLYYNGVVVTSGTGGGGISGSDNITFSGVNTFTHKNTFSDTLKADGLSLIDNARITSNLAVTGDVTTNLGFLKGSSTSIGTISTDSLAIITNNTKRMIFTKDGKMSFNDSLIMTSYDIFLPNGKGLNWGETVGLIYNNAGELINKSDINTTYTLHGNFLNSSDSSTGFLVRNKLEGYTDTVTSASKWFFTDLINFATTVTFTVSPVFSALVNFANGINVTGNATVSGDLNLSGWTKNQSSLNRDQYEKIKIVRTVMPAVTGTNSVAHGIANWHTITGFTTIVMDDTTNFMSQSQNQYSTTQTLFNVWWIDSLNVNVKTPAAATGMPGDTVKFRITYTDYDR